MGTGAPGCALPPGWSREALEATHAVAAERREDVRERMDVGDMELAALCWRLEQQVNKNLMKAALDHAERILHHFTVDGGAHADNIEESTPPGRPVQRVAK